MGLLYSDLSGDHLEDIVVSHWVGDAPALYQRLPSASGAVQFTDRADPLGLASCPRDRVGWAVGAVDFENDGKEEILIVNGHTDHPTGQDQLLMAQQMSVYIPDTAGRYNLISSSGPGDPQSVPLIGRGAVFADFDRDGARDVIIGCNNAAASYWHNRGATGGWVELFLVGTTGCRDGWGTRVELLSPAVAGAARTVERVRSIVSGESYFSSTDPHVHFGLGKRAGPLDFRVSWPNGRVEEFRGLAHDQRHRLVQGNGVVAGVPPR